MQRRAAAAKIYHKAPIQIANAVKEQLAGCEMFESVEAVNPGFLNFKLSAEFLASYVAEMNLAEHFGVQPEQNPRTIVVDYGGPNVAKPLHVGHLRSAIIGESIKRIYRFFGNHVIGDIHLGDWGLQMGLIIAQVQSQRPELCYFDPDYTGEYPEEAPFTISELEKIYPEASARSKVDASLPRRRTTRRIYSSRASAATAPCGSESCAFRSRTSKRTTKTSTSL